MNPTLFRLADVFVKAGKVGSIAALYTMGLSSAYAQRPVPKGTPELTFADVADLADPASMVVRAQIRKLIRIENAQASASGKGRFYVMAETRALLAGSTPLGKTFAYLVDIPLDAKGKPLVRNKDIVIVFARPVEGRAGELQLVRPNAQLGWSEGVESKVRDVVTQLLAHDAPAKIQGVRELLFVPGTLAGEGETQIFLNTADGSAASLTVRHQPNQPPRWGASFSELVAEVGEPPAQNTLTWYRLACFLPANPPMAADVSESDTSRRVARADYRLVINSLGPCRRSI